MFYADSMLLPNRQKHGLTKTTGTCFALALLAASPQTQAHVEYYDLNQGEQISDLTSNGVTASTVQYGLNTNTPTSMTGLNQNSDRALNNTANWNADYQNYTGVGSFTNTQTSTASGTVGTFYNSNVATVNDVTDYGWGAGTWGTASSTQPDGTGLLADTHKVDFFNFRLDQSSTVSISWNVIDSADSISVDSGFSLYSGVASYQAHDDATDSLNPKSGVPPHKIQDVLDSGTVTDAQGIASAYRNTLTNSASYVGQFNALSNWGDGNAAGNWSNVAYLAYAHSLVSGGYSTTYSDTLATMTITLPAGNYTIAAAGALGSSFGDVSSFGLTNLQGVLSYSAVSAVPVPGAAWLFGSALIGAIGLGKRKQL